MMWLPARSKRLILAIWDPRIPFMCGTLKGVGRIYQQTFIDTYAKVGFAKLYTTKTPITAADLLNDKVLPFYEKHQLPLLRINPATEYLTPDHFYATSCAWKK